ncbi:MAG TPA: cytochrome c [Cellvibrionaceae bacterium]
MQLSTTKSLRTLKLISGAALLALSGQIFAADPAPADKPDASKGPNPAKQAIKLRQATFTLIASNFKLIGDVLQDKAPYDAAEIAKRAKRVAFLTEFLDGTFPDVSNLGEPDTKAKSEVWSKSDDFQKRVKDFKEHANALATLVTKDNTNSAAFKSAAEAVAKDCKGCHDNYKVK